MSIIASFAVPHPPLIIPEVGKGREKEVQKTIYSYETIAQEIANLKPDTIVISSPHTICFRDYFYISSNPIMKGSFASFGAKDVSFEEFIDEELVDEIEKIAKKEEFPTGRIQQEIELDHGTMVPLYFIRKYNSKAKIVVVGLSGLSKEDHYHLGEIINEAIEHLGRKVVYVASGDLSHKLQEDGPYGFAEEGKLYEEKIIQTMSQAKFDELFDYSDDLLEKAAECGHPSFIILSGALKGRNVIPKFYSHEDVTGVGYGIWSYYPEDEYVSLAKQSIESYVKNHKKMMVPDHLSKKLLEEQKGVFVSIHKFGELRGCIGTFLPTEDCIAKEIISNAIYAATRDPRFPEITEDELADLEIHVDVLSTPEDISSKEELDPKKYGVIVYKDFRRGLLLPDLEGVDTVEEQVEIAKKKAGISPEEDVSLQRFEVVRHK